MRVVLAFMMVCACAGAEVYHKSSVVKQEELFKLGPYVTYPEPGAAEIRWWTDSPMASTVQYTDGNAPAEVITQKSFKSEHVVTLMGLAPDTVYTYRIPLDDTGETMNEYLFDTTFNYSVPRVSSAQRPDVEALGDEAEIVSALHKAGAAREGYAVIFGADPALAFELVLRTELQVTCLETDALNAQRARAALSDAGLYGTRITIREVDSYADVPVTSHYANVVLLEAARYTDTIGEAYRLLRPQNTLYPIRADVGTELRVPDGASTTHADTSSLIGIRKPKMQDAGAWTHQYGDASNASYSGDTLGGAGGVPDMEVQWLGKPGADFGIDRNPRMPAPLSINGRLFHQGLDRMIAVDAYNGTVLWLHEIPGLRRVNIPRDASNWCADDTNLYTVVREQCWKFDQHSGELLKQYTLPVEGVHEWSFAARYGGMLYASHAKPGSTYTDFWGKAAWYDGTSGVGTYKVCSEALYGLDEASGDVAWQYSNGKIINTTIAINEEKVVFVETRHPSLTDVESSRIEADEFWLDQYMVALDARTGELLWEQPVDVEDGLVVFYVSHRNGKVVLVSSANGKFFLYGYDDQTGEQVWRAEHEWTADNHGGHMQHQAITRNTVFLEPCGYDLHTGERKYDNIGNRSGCATRAATDHALIYRGDSRRVAMWSIDEQKASTWMNLRPSCWLSVVPANGMIMAPEGGGGCSCGTWMETSFGFMPALALNQ